MKYDSKQIELDLSALRHNKEITMQQFHKLTGAIELAEMMLKNALEQEQKDAENAPKHEENKEEVVTDFMQAEDVSA